MSKQGIEILTLLYKKKISLITKSEIRYRGTLDNINQKEYTITLANVHSYGTEGRRPGSEIQPQGTKFDLIVFKGNDIKDIKVEDDDTMLSSQQQQQDKKKDENQKEQNSKNPITNTTKEEKKQEEELDFEKMNESFDRKLKLQQEQEQSKVQKYEPNNFFDTISSSTTQKKSKQSQFEMKEEKQQQEQINTETFGSDYNLYQKQQSSKNRSYRGNRGGGRRGNNRGYRNVRGNPRYMNYQNYYQPMGYQQYNPNYGYGYGQQYNYNYEQVNKRKPYQQQQIFYDKKKQNDEA